ncbi:TetR/AcrR family transcriptional regulator [Pseudooceanicola sp. LIPI14-2-Ac024]|uniref:TetR/AcrR family transcriptional regulator n=1 Tax=Pseudooceanicola sp. LIPI14-2-Ac024 TaxID=3344875 RepID=UPI0035D05BB4
MGLKLVTEPDAPAARRILDAAEMLFARHGVNATSVRQITREAGVNVASVNYYFGSKDDLAEAVFERVIARVTADRLAGLKRIVETAEAAGTPPDLAAVVSSFIEPYMGDGNEDQGVLLARFILSHRLSPDGATKRIVDTHLNPMAQAYVAAMAKAAPGVDGTELYWRYLLMVSATVLTSTEDRSEDRLRALSDGRASVADRSAARDALVSFAVAGIRAEAGTRFVAGTLENLETAPE